MSKSTGISSTASGSVPFVHPSENFGTGGMSASLPRGAPASTHAAIVSIGSRDRLLSLRIFSEYSGSAPHGGISRAVTFVLITFAHGRTSSYDSSDIGATSPGRWQLAHLSKTIGATSLANVGVPAAGAVWTMVDATHARVPLTANSRRFMNPPGRPEGLRYN